MFLVDMGIELIVVSGSTEVDQFSEDFEHLKVRCKVEGIIYINFVCN
jgi:hypothetical protein